jgi:hypothetical protein
LRSLVSSRSSERYLYTVAALPQSLARVLRRERFDVVRLEGAY